MTSPANLARRATRKRTASAEDQEASAAREKAVFDDLKNAHEKCSEAVRVTSLALVGLCAFIVITMYGTADAKLLGSSPEMKLPILGVELSAPSFILFSGIIVIAFSLYLHVFVGRWRDLTLQLAKLSPRHEHHPSPTLFNIHGKLPAALSLISLYLLPPLTLAAAAWKAAVRIEWLVVAAGYAFLLTAYMAYLFVIRSIANDRIRGTGSWAASLVIICVFVGFAANAEHLRRPLMLQRANLDNADLRELGFFSSRLVPADLRGAQMQSASLVGAHLEGADLRGANLGGANLQTAKLCGVDMRGANLEFASLQGADFHQKMKCTEHGVDREFADLRGALLVGADLSAATFAAALMQGADLTYAKAPFTDFGGARLDGAFLGEGDFTGADFRSANLRLAVLPGGPGKIYGANFSSANLEGADMNSSDVAGVTGLESAKFLVTDLRESACAGGPPVEDLELMSERVGADQDKRDDIKRKIRDLKSQAPRMTEIYSCLSMRELLNSSVCTKDGKPVDCEAVQGVVLEDTVLALVKANLCKDPYLTLGLLRRARSSDSLDKPVKQFLADRADCPLPDSKSSAPGIFNEVVEYRERYGLVAPGRK